MRIILTSLIFLAGLFDLFIGLGFLFSPVSSGAGFGLVPQGPAGMAVLRADFTSFFCVSAFCMMWGAWRRNADLLLVPALLFGTALVGRTVSIIVDGTAPGFWFPMLIEVGHVVLLLAAWRMLPHHKINDLAG